MSRQGRWRSIRAVGARALHVSAALALFCVAGFAQDDIDFLDDPVARQVFGDAESRFLARAPMRGGGAAAVQVQPGCPTFSGWDAQQDLTESELWERLEVLRQELARPISISATADGAGGNPRFDITAVVDEFGDPPELWEVRIGQNFQEVQDIPPDFRAVAIDAYAAPQAGLTHYASIIVKDGRATRMEVETSLANLQTMDAHNQGQGFTPIWVDGFRRGGLTRYSAIWLDDGIARIIDPAPQQFGDDLNAEWRQRTSDGGNLGGVAVGGALRMLRMTRFPLETGEGDTVGHYLAVWQRDCTDRRIWSAFPDQAPMKYEVMVAAQNPLDEVRTIDDGAISLSMGDLALPVRIAVAEDPEDLALGEIIVSDGTPPDGALVVLAAAPGAEIRVVDDFNPTFVPPDLEPFDPGNIRLTRWDAEAGLEPGAVDQHQDCVLNAPLQGCSGQTKLLDDFQDRIALAYDAGEAVWREVTRDGLPPDIYHPLATDAYLDESGERRLSTVWVGPPFQRRFWRNSAAPPIPIGNQPLTSDEAADIALQPLDQAVETYMTERQIPGGALAVVVNGRLAVARSYTYAPPGWLAAEEILPTGQFRLASVSKSITALAIMRLVDAGLLELDWRLDQVEGLFDVIGADWTDVGLPAVTIRQLLGHLGGWDRDIGDEPLLGRDFEICDLVGSDLPVTVAQGLTLAREVVREHPAGATFAYSNFGYTLLGRVIEAVTDQPYEDFVRANVLIPAGVGMDIGRNTLVGSQEEPVPEVHSWDVENRVTASRLGVPLRETHTLRDGCSANHAEQYTRPEAGSNFALMDSHGGWIASAPAVARLYAAAPNLLTPESLGEYWAAIPGREARYYLRDAAGLVDHSFGLRTGCAPAIAVCPLAGSPIPLDQAGDTIEIARGFLPFNEVAIDVNVPTNVIGTYTLSFAYRGHGGFVLPLTVQDGTNGLSQDGTISFTMPDDFAPTSAFDDGVQRYWIRMRSDSVTIPPVSIEQITVNNALTYGMGLYSEPETLYLDVVNFASPVPTAGWTIVGEGSQASAEVTGSMPVVSGTRLLLTHLSGGSFRRDEALFAALPNSSPQVGRVGPNRERVLEATNHHGGVLPGSEADAWHRPWRPAGAPLGTVADDLTWVLLFNQRNHLAPFYVSDQSSRDLNPAIDLVTAWPSWDLLPP
jgi:CubicO group peptidase (beta-lactamase class C family)